jgi:hypothetical protein
MKLNPFLLALFLCFALVLAEETTTFQLDIQSEPQDALIYINNRLVGKTNKNQIEISSSALKADGSPRNFVVKTSIPPFCRSHSSQRTTTVPIPPLQNRNPRFPTQ